MPRAATTFSLIGGGWRAEYFLRIARALPERFAIGHLLVRDAAKGRALEESFGVRTHRTLDELIAAGPADFVIVCVGGDPAPMIEAVAERGLPVLAETPPSRDEAPLRRLNERARAGGWRIQIAEQYPFIPIIAAQIAVARSGRIGRAQQAHVSVAHGYHGMAIMRRLLGWGRGRLRVRAQCFGAAVAGLPQRRELPTRESTGQEHRIVATLVADDGTMGLFDFTGTQYSGWIRSNRVQVRGDRGELSDTMVRWLADFRTPLQAEMTRRVSGQDVNIFEGQGHLAWSLGDEILHRSRFPGSRLIDDELAVAECLHQMSLYAAGGEGYYGLEEASHDAWIERTILRCVENGQERVIEGMPWMEGAG
jgi:predicted dehydrogenase